MEDIILNEDQKIARDKIIDWYEHHKDTKPIFTLAGYAGTGKTFLVKHIVNDELKIQADCAYVAFTGKAASVLIQRGATNVSTIHKLIYNRVEIENTVKINDKTIKIKKFEFVKKPAIPKFKLIVVDEISMVDRDLLEDLLSFGIPLLCCGDSGQLPAITKSNDLLDRPDAQLTQIVRQEEGNAIVKIAQMARLGQPIPCGNYGNVIVTDFNHLSEEQLKKLYLKADQVLCGTNRTRHMLNRKIKAYKNLKLDEANENEKIICLLNNWECYLDEDLNYPLVNGTIGFIQSLEKAKGDENLSLLSFRADFLTDVTDELIFDDGVFKNNGALTYDFHQNVYVMSDGSYKIQKTFEPKGKDESIENYNKRVRELAMIKRDAVERIQVNFFDSAYAISVHKSQGSEWNNVVLIDESNIFNCPEKWLYTGITRAKKHLIIIK